MYVSIILLRQKNCLYLNRKPVIRPTKMQRDFVPPLALPYSLPYNPFDMPILDEHTLDFFSRSPEQTRRIGIRLGRLLQPGDVLCLEGDLGAGKTTLVQGLAQGWGSLDSVSSPTFILVNVYRRPDEGRLFHLDAYRLDSAPEAEELDLDEMLTRGPLVVEWARRVASILPDERLWVNLDYVADEHRQMRFRAQGARPDSLLAELRQAMFGIA
jgi:tRNA threonylcarbamoyladenosine biosynthesis protein TsaE